MKIILECDCMIDPNTEKDHNCDVNDCTSVAHFRKDCLCEMSFTNQKHDGTLCEHCRA